MDRYNYDLDHGYNTIELSGHRGRHTNYYHDTMLQALKELDAIADGDLLKFLEGMKAIYDCIEVFPYLPYAGKKK